MRTLLTYTAVLIGAYLVVAYATNAGSFVTAAGNTYAQGVRVLQGRG